MSRLERPPVGLESVGVPQRSKAGDEKDDTLIETGPNSCSVRTGVAVGFPMHFREFFAFVVFESRSVNYMVFWDLCGVVEW